MIHSNFVCSTALDGFDAVVVDGEAAIERFEEIYTILREEAGEAAADFLCEPLISFGNGAAPTTISWYARYDGPAVPFTALDPARREVADTILKARVDALLGVAGRSPRGALLASALNLPAPSDAYLVGNQPVLTNWGILPAGAVASDARRRAAMAAGLGALGIVVAPPPTASADLDAWRRGLAFGRGTAAQGTAASFPTPPAGRDAAADIAFPAAVATEAAEVRRQRAWLPPMIVCLLATVLLIVLLVPGVLLYPERVAIAAIDDQAEALRESNEALEERLAQLRGARGAGVCTAEGDIDLPGAPPPLAPGPAAPGDALPGPAPAPSAPTEQGANPTAPGDAAPPASLETLLPPPLDTLAPTESPSGGPTGSLLEHLDAGTVLVLAPLENAVGVGTGFFVNGDTVITNDHVISEGDPARIFVVSKALGAVVPVTIVARTNVHTPGELDFAALRGSFGTVGQMAVSTRIERLDQVVAAGFPSIVNEGSEAFRNVVGSGDVSNIPPPSTTRGVVTAIYDNTRGVPVIAHDAEISRGNSGGPLVDLCGRVIGVNTFTVLDRETSAVARYSLSAKALVKFMADNGIAASISDTPCVPTRIAAAPESQPPAPQAEPPAVEPAVPAAPEAPVEAPAQSAPQPLAPEPPAAQPAPPAVAAVAEPPAEVPAEVPAETPPTTAPAVQPAPPVTPAEAPAPPDLRRQPGVSRAAPSDGLPPGAYIDQSLAPK